MYLLYKLYETYQKNLLHVGKWGKRYGGKTPRGNDIIDPVIPLLPYGYSTQHAQITVSLNKNGDFKDAWVNKVDDTNTIIPVTEKSSSRTSKAVPHPLYDKLQYVAGDYLEYGGDKKKYTFPAYLEQLTEWKEFDPDNPILAAIHKYVSKGTLIKDLVDHSILFYDEKSGHLANKWQERETEIPPIFNAIASQYDSFIRWEVRTLETKSFKTWENEELRNSWRRFLESKQSAFGLCYVSGKESILAELHPSKIRNGGDKAKIISSNDSSGFTFRGKFIGANEACGVSSEITQKAHSALRWLIARQGKTFDSMAIVAWSPGKSVTDNEILQPVSDDDDWEKQSENLKGTDSILGLSFSEMLKGYDPGSKNIFDDDLMLIVSLDSATPGRMAVTYFNKFKFSEYRENVWNWHNHCKWEQYLGKGKTADRAPVPKRITEAAYGKQSDTKLLRQTVKRLLPCIVEGTPIPEDIIHSCLRRAVQRVALEPWEWRQLLGVTCALYNFNSFCKKAKQYAPIINEREQDRSYLFGRLLALAEYIEKQANGNDHTTHAERITLRFYDHPSSSWLQMEKALAPYLATLCKRDYRLYLRLRQRLDQIICLFNTSDFTSDQHLDAPYLIGYFCENKRLWENAEDRQERLDYITKQDTNTETPTEEKITLPDIEPSPSPGYLFGRLLAIAEHIERVAPDRSYWKFGEDKKALRPGPAEKYFTRFLTHPADTWQIIELNIAPYWSIMMKTSRKPQIVLGYKKQLDDIMSHFPPQEFMEAKALDSRFSLGYHHQRCLLMRYEAEQLLPQPTHSIPDESCRDRSYIYGRLLGLAEAYEYKALNASKVNRPDNQDDLPEAPRITNADRLIASFVNAPSDAWPNLRKQLKPYLQKHYYNSWEQQWKNKFEEEAQRILSLLPSIEKETLEKLSPLFLLGYHHERLNFNNKKDSPES